MKSRSIFLFSNSRTVNSLRRFHALQTTFESIDWIPESESVLFNNATAFYYNSVLSETGGGRRGEGRGGVGRGAVGRGAVRMSLEGGRVWRQEGLAEENCD